MDGPHFTIRVPDISQIDHLTRWIHESRSVTNANTLSPHHKICIDFSHAGIIRPYHITSLACIIHEYIANGHEIILTNTSAYLRSFNFKQFCDQVTGANSFPTPDYPDTLPLWRIEKEACNIYPKQVQEYFERNQFYGKDLFGLGLSLGELMNNVFDHAECTIPGYTFTQ